MAGPYQQSVEYDLTVLAQWLPRALDAGAVAIILGDHQPPAVVGGELQQWTVPIHVLSRDPDLVAPFIAAGYVDGLFPPPNPPPPRLRR